MKLRPSSLRSSPSTSRIAFSNALAAVVLALLVLVFLVDDHGVEAAGIAVMGTTVATMTSHYPVGGGRNAARTPDGNRLTIAAMR